MPENMVIVAPQVRWVQIDLEKQCELYAILIWHDFSLWDVCEGVVVQASNDPEFAKDVHTLFNNDYRDLNHLGAGADLEYYETNFGKLIDAHAVRSRYLRFYCRGDHSALKRYSTYIEIEAWGLPVDTIKPVGSTNTAPPKLAPLPLKLPAPAMM